MAFMVSIGIGILFAWTRRTDRASLANVTACWYLDSAYCARRGSWSWDSAVNRCASALHFTAWIHSSRRWNVEDAVVRSRSRESTVRASHDPAEIGGGES